MSYLDSDDQHKILSAYKSRNNQKWFAINKSISEIAANDYSLNISLYVESEDVTKPGDTLTSAEVVENWTRASQEIVESSEKFALGIQKLDF